MATLIAETVTGPAYWASYLINGDSSGMNAAEMSACASWLKRAGLSRIDFVSCDDEPRFTWHFDLYGGACRGGEVLEYQLLRSA